ncbi:unnamed protein product [Orchesella dallaii]|uniref:HRDC domain-containing protein n=1 Tax=Orchesella dallaii TaxID=48710 RepID=A0ABP1QHS7_9HEXA
MQTIRGNELAQARQKWGVQRIRPHTSIPGFLEWRKSINNAIFPSVHPFDGIIREWRLTSDMIATASLIFPRILKYVRTEAELIDCTLDLEDQQELAVDLEMNSDTFFNLICVIQISTLKTDYVIDALTLFSKIKDNLGPILENPTKLKVFHSCNDLIHLQRNFNVFTVGMIDTQEVFEITTGRKDISLANMVQGLLNIEISKVAQRADWRLSPLPNELLEYAASDTRLLFQCWIRLKHDAVSIESESFPKSIQRTLQLVSSLRSNTAAGAWHSYVNLLNHNKDMLNRFGTVGQSQLFMKLFEWREQVGKEFDIHPNKVLRDRELQFVARAMPSSMHTFCKIALINKLVAAEKYETALRIIEDTRSTVFENTELANRKLTRRVVVVEHDSDSDMDWDSSSSTRCVAHNEESGPILVSPPVNQAIELESTENQAHGSNTIGWSVSASSSVHLILTGTLSLLSSVKEPKNRRKGRIASASSSEQRISTSPSSQYHN